MAIDANASTGHYLHSEATADARFYLVARQAFLQIKRRLYQIYKIKRSRAPATVDRHCFLRVCLRVASQVEAAAAPSADKWCGNTAIQQCAGGAGAVKN